MARSTHDDSTGVGPSHAEEGRAPTRDELVREIDALVDACRTTCLWYVRRDYYPRTDDERWRVLDDIQAHADLATFERAGRLKRWLSPPSSDGSARS